MNANAQTSTSRTQSLFHDCSRRQFLHVLGAAGLASGLGVAAHAAEPAAAWDCSVGVCSSSSQWNLIKKAGCSYVEESVGGLLKPKLSNAEFAPLAEQFKAKSISVPACNSFLPGDMKLVGPDTRPDDVVAYATKVFQRAALLKVRIVVLGSGAARKVPEGFDPAKAADQFVSLVKRLGAAASASRVTLAMEPLNRGETNFGNTLAECLKLIDAVNLPSVKLVADMYHMLKVDEKPDILVQAGSKVVHCHIAEKAQRTPPGTDGDDFKPYLCALKQAGFTGCISLECRWKNLAGELAPAVAALKQQIAAVGSA